MFFPEQDSFILNHPFKEKEAQQIVSRRDASAIKNKNWGTVLKIVGEIQRKKNVQYKETSTFLLSWAAILPFFNLQFYLMNIKLIFFLYSSAEQPVEGTVDYII